MANEKSIFKYLICAKCGYKTADTTGKATGVCKNDGETMYLSKNWFVRITHKGRSPVKSVSPRKRDAEDYLAECKVKIKAGTFTTATQEAARKQKEEESSEKDILWDQAKADCTLWWGDAVKKKDITQSTADYYKWQMVPLSNYFGEKSLLTIRKADVLDYMTARIDDGAAPVTINHEIKALKRIYSLYVARTSSEESPKLVAKHSDIARVTLLKKTSEKARYLTESEITLLLEKATTPAVKIATLIALNTGLRRSNVLGLTWHEVKLSKRLIEIPGYRMKSTRPHTVDIPEHLVITLKAWRDGNNLSRFLFPDSTNHAPLSNFRAEWDKTINACGFTDVTFHTLRHSYASQFLMAGGDLSTLSEILDHSSIQITKDTYGHLSRAHLRKGADEFADKFLSHFS